MKLVTSDQMRTLEKIAIEEYAIPGIILMENAAIRFCDELEKHINLQNKNICIFCGKGNNGGDGFAIARHLVNGGYCVSCITSFDINNAKNLLTDDAYINFSTVQKMGISICNNTEDINKYDVIIDALLGTGISGCPREAETNLIEQINKSNAFVVSVDIPSGANASNGEVLGACVCADMTITFCFAKVGHFLYPAKEHVGKLSVVPISVPNNVLCDFESGINTLSGEIFDFLPKRHDNSHKGTFGKVLAVCGSIGMSGAAMLSVSAVLKSGAGMVTAATSDDVIKNIVLNTPEAMTLSLDTERYEKNLLSALEKNDVLLLGCGMGRREKAKEITGLLAISSEKPMIIDADGINNLSVNINILNRKKAPLILTPHTVEFSRLTGYDPKYIEENRYNLALEFAKKYDVILVLKGADTIVASPDGAVYISPISNSGLATAGSGDVLSGIIAGFLAQGAKPYYAAACGVYTHSLAGEFAKKELGERSMTANDIIANIPKVLRDVK